MCREHMAEVHRLRGVIADKDINIARLEKRVDLLSEALRKIILSPIGHDICKNKDHDHFYSCQDGNCRLCIAKQALAGEEK